MHKLLLLTLLAPALTWAAPLKTLDCDNGYVDVAITVQQDMVEWTITGKNGADLGRFSGYLFADKNLASFSSTDDGSDLEVNGNTAKVSYGDVTAELNCR
jgi:hypothetical protein